MEDDDDFDGPGSVGYHIHIPPEVSLPKRVMGAYGLRSEGSQIAEHRRVMWTAELQDCAKLFRNSMRAVAQPETTDFVGFPSWWVAVWADVTGEDIEKGRVHFESWGYHVSSITLEYDPPMA